MVSLGGEEALPPGSRVEFKTVLGQTIAAQVVSFDPSLKVLAVRDTSGSDGKPLLRIFNMSTISDIKELSAKSSDSLDNMFSPCSLSTQQVQDRTKHAMERRLAEAMPENVSLDGQKAFMSLRRILHDHVIWKGVTIEVLQQVLVEPPYKVENASAIDSSEKAQNALERVKKVLAKPYVPEKQTMTAVSMQLSGTSLVSSADSISSDMAAKLGKSSPSPRGSNGAGRGRGSRSPPYNNNGSKK